ncbi:alpha/beta fold hydrolase [Xylophilus rhododendri]|uniref:Alpha/beta fold hydrolase n=1 Tax=Xylophilus rhododendri TaxID=2697032 RepID=A0A857JB68_9BURK|nr:alpha/beta hydrolase [Xylophilus rhododendri]QHJ00223.1 alpha/beta fold hydrolase [Xylophilus rhododendri]
MTTGHGPRRRQLLQVLAGAAALPWLASGCATQGGGGVLRQRTVTSSASDQVPLAVFESGNPRGRPVIFIHGFAQSHESWMRQLQAPELQGELRLIAFDLRGHGDSGKPLAKEAYHDPRKWAQDLQSVIQASGAAKPTLVAWSYGGRVLNDYLSVFGDGDVGALDYVAATSTGQPFGQGSAARLMGPMLSDDAALVPQADAAFLRACFEKQPGDADFEAMRRFNAQCPVAVRKLLAGRPANYDDTLRRLKVPVLVTHGDRDRISAVAMSEYTVSLVPQARLSLYPGIGHSSFHEDPARFNAELLALARQSG